MELSLQINGMQEMSLQEQRETDGGWIGIAIVIVVVVVIFAAGVYSGYRDAAANDK